MRCGSLVPRVVPVLLVAGLLAAGTGGVGTGHAGQTFDRVYEGSSAVAYGGPGMGGQFQGFTACNNDQDTVFDTAACLHYRKTGSGGWDYRGWEFEVRLHDVALGAETWYLVAIDAAGNNNVNCVPSSPDVCLLAKGTVRATIPAGSQGEVLRVLPLTYYASGLACCPESTATRGTITVAFPAP